MSKYNPKYKSIKKAQKKKVTTEKKQLWISKNYPDFNKLILALTAIGVIGVVILLLIQHYYLALVISYISILLIIIDVLLYFYSTKKKHLDVFITILLALCIFSYLFASSIIDNILNLIEQEKVTSKTLIPPELKETEKLETPEIELSVAEPLDPFDPLEYPFVIKNVGKTKILDLNINEKQIIEADRGNSMNGQFTSIYLQTTELLPHESTTFVLGHIAKLERIRKITVIFMISYNTTSGQTINRELKYVGVRTQEWAYNWYPKSMAED